MDKLVGFDARITVNENVLLCRKGPIDGSVEVVIPKVFCQAIFYNGPHPN